jgi:hypothetical protein
MADLSPQHPWRNPGSSINNDLKQFMSTMPTPAPTALEERTSMAEQHRATPEQWEALKACTAAYPGAWGDCILELRDRVEALEAAQLEQAESNR